MLNIVKMCNTFHTTIIYCNIIVSINLLQIYDNMIDKYINTSHLNNDLKLCSKRKLELLSTQIIANYRKHIFFFVSRCRIQII